MVLAQAVLRAAELAGALRLRHAGGNFGAAGCGQPEAAVCGAGGGRIDAAGHQRREPAQVPGPGDSQDHCVHHG